MLEDKPDVKCNKGSIGVTARPHSAELPTSGKELEKGLSSEGNPRQRADADVMERRAKF